MTKFAISARSSQRSRVASRSISVGFTEAAG
jgi:hypothetical protein